MKIKYTVESSTKSLRSLFGHCQLRVFLDDHSFIDIGRFSSSAIDRFRMYRNLEKTGCLAKIGDFCEFANSEILLGGEHRNQEVVNQVLSGCPPFQTLLQRNGFKTTHGGKGIVEIGHGVIVSHGSKILTGVKIGNGSIIAAGAVVTKEIPEFSIAGGIPAKVIKPRDVDRSDCMKFWELSIQGIFSYVTGKNLGVTDEGYSRENKLVIKMVGGENESEDGKFSGFEIKGVQIGKKFIQPKPSSQFMEYCKQVNLKKGAVAEWVSDPFKLALE